MSKALFTLILRIADDQLICGHRLSEWASKAPSIEQDLALSNMALDLLGQADALYQYAAEIVNDGRNADDLAFLRSDREYSNLLLLEIPNGDFARTILRHFCFALFMRHFWEELSQRADTKLAAIAGKSLKELSYHVRHCSEWVIRLGDGTTESQHRLQKAYQHLEPYLGEIFADDPLSQELADLCPLPSSLKSLWLKDFSVIAKQSYLEIPQLDLKQHGGRKGLHTEDLGYLLAEMQFLQRAYPEAKW